MFINTWKCKKYFNNLIVKIFLKIGNKDHRKFLKMNRIIPRINVNKNTGKNVKSKILEQNFFGTPLMPYSITCQISVT